MIPHGVEVFVGPEPIDVLTPMKLKSLGVQPQVVTCLVRLVQPQADA